MRPRIKTNRILSRAGRVPPVSRRPIKESKFLALPSEIIHTVLAFLETKELFACMVVCRQIKQIIDESIQFKYRIELFSEYLVEGDGSFGTAKEQLRHLEQCREAWLRLIPLKQEWVDFRGFNMPNSRYIFDLHEGVWAYSRRPFGTITSAATTSTEDATNTNIDDGDDENSKANSKIPPISILLTELPASATLGLPMEPKQLDIDLRFKEIIMDVSQNLLILFVSSRPGATVYLRTISDNSPHPEAASPTIRFPECGRLYKISVCDDKIAILSQNQEDHATDGQTRWWNWKTGKLLGAIDRGSCMVFLSSAYLAVLTYQRSGVCCHILSAESFSVVRAGSRSLTEPICNLSFPEWVDHVEMNITAYESHLSTHKTYRRSESSQNSDHNQSPTSLGRVRPHYADKDADLFVIHFEPLDHQSFLAFFRKSTLLKRAIQLAHSFPNMRSDFKWETWGPSISRWIRTPDDDLWSCSLYGLRFICFSTANYAHDTWGHLLPKQEGRKNGVGRVKDKHQGDGDQRGSSIFPTIHGRDLFMKRPPELPVLNIPNAHINPTPIRLLNAGHIPSNDVNVYSDPSSEHDAVLGSVLPTQATNLDDASSPPSDDSDTEPPSPELEEASIKTHLLVLDFNPRPIARGANFTNESNISKTANHVNTASRMNGMDDGTRNNRPNEEHTSSDVQGTDDISDIHGGSSYSIDSADCFVVTEDSVHKDWFKNDVVSRMPFRAFASRMALPMTLDAVGIENENIILANFSDNYEHGELAGLVVLTF